MRRRQTTTIRDVARAAQLSPAAVSRYLNGDIVLPEKSASRIERAVRDLRYQPNLLARNLSLGQSKMVGLVIPDISNPFFARLACAVEEVAFQAGYGVLLCNTQNDRDRELAYVKLLNARQLDGILFLTSHAGDPELAKALSRNQRVVLIDEDIAGIAAPRVFCRNREGGYLAAKHLLENGHSRIGYIGGPKNLLSSQERFAGFRRGLREEGIKPEFVQFGPYTAEFGRETALTFLQTNQMPTAIFASSDYVALGVLGAARRLGLEIPEELSLVGFDDMPFAELLYPPLTTIRQPIAELGRAGLQLLLRLIGEEVVEPPVLRLPVQLIKRASVHKLKSPAKKNGRSRI
jgi:LacI family transcriptional regulator, galactose operon repressor